MEQPIKNLDNKIKDHKNKNLDRQNRNRNLELRMSVLEQKMKAFEQKSLSTSLKIASLLETTPKDTVHILETLPSKLEVNVNDMQSARRLTGSRIQTSCQTANDIKPNRSTPLKETCYSHSSFPSFLNNRGAHTQLLIACNFNGLG